jgi:hypothetical protein
MPLSSPVKRVAIIFPSIALLSNFKQACTCNDFYVDRDAFTLVGTFTEDQLQIANKGFLAVIKDLPSDSTEEN